MSDFEVSQSKLKAWRRCHMQYNYNFVQKLEKRKPKLQLLRGTMIGRCLDAIAHRRWKKNDFKVHYSEVLGEYAKQYRTLFDEEREYYGDIVSDVASIIFRYDQIYADDGLSYYVQGNRNFEINLSVDLAPGIVFTGHMDKYAIDRDERYWVMDHKSAKTIPDEETRFGDLQLVFYYWAAPLSGLPKPSGVLWDYVRTKAPAVPETLKAGGLSQRKNIDTDYQTYLTAIEQNKLDPKDYREILAMLKERGTQDFFKRIYLPGPSKELVRNVVRDARETAQEIVHLGEVSKSRAMTRDCKMCKFYTLCQAEVRGLDADFIRKTEYQEVKTIGVKAHVEEESE